MVVPHSSPCKLRQPSIRSQIYERGLFSYSIYSYSSSPYLLPLFFTATLSLPLDSRLVRLSSFCIPSPLSNTHAPLFLLLSVPSYSSLLPSPSVETAWEGRRNYTSLILPFPLSSLVSRLSSLLSPLSSLLSPLSPSPSLSPALSPFLSKYGAI